MNVALQRVMTVAEYLAWAERQDEDRRAELINGQIVLMSPERAAHNRAKIRTLNALGRAVHAAALPCEVFVDGMTVPIDAHTSYEPDVLVSCGAAIPPTQVTVPAPVIVAEVLSPATVHTDTSAKLVGYFKLPSVHNYLVIDTDARAVTHHARMPDGSIAARTHKAAALRLDPPGIDLNISDILE